MLYVGDEKLEVKDLPHCTKMTKMVLDEFKKEWRKFAEDMKKAEGRILYTTDLWSDLNLDSFMAITAHYIFCPTTGLLQYWCNLIAFQHIKGSHSGANLAMHFFALIDGLRVAHKVCSSLCFISKSL